MKPLNIIIPVITAAASGVAAFFMGRHFGIKEFADELSCSSVGDLDILPHDDGNAEIFLRLNSKEAINTLKKEKYVIFSVTLLEEEPIKKKADA